MLDFLLYREIIRHFLFHDPYTLLIGWLHVFFENAWNDQWFDLVLSSTWQVSLFACLGSSKFPAEMDEQFKDQ